MSNPGAAKRNLGWSSGELPSKAPRVKHFTGKWTDVDRSGQRGEAGFLAVHPGASWRHVWEWKAHTLRAIKITLKHKMPMILLKTT